MKYARIPAVALLALLLAGCGSDDDDDGGSGGGAAANCAARCETKLSGCQQAQAAATCQALCDDGMTETQLRCAEGKSCDEIRQAGAAGEALCGIGEGGGNGGACPTLECTCPSGQQVNGVVQIRGRCATTCAEACDALGNIPQF